MPSTRSWGIGEIPDLSQAAAWLASAGFDFQLLLPVNEMAEGQSSPYSAVSAMAIDPLFIGLETVVDLVALGGEDALSGEDRQALAAVRASPRIEYEAVRALKHRAFEAAFHRFVDHEWSRHSRRSDRLRAYLDAERWWLDDYALYRALRAAAGGRAWTTWDAPLATRDEAALDRARRELARPILFYQYLQWVASEQWDAARRDSRSVGVFGDFPFVVSQDSADVWAHQADFRFDATVGTPPDAFSETGQDWGLPPYRWDVLARHDYTWLRQRARRMSALYDAYRIDHLVGFYRTCIRPIDGSPSFFSPSTEHEQLELGQRLLGIFADAGPRVIAEDLGTVPDVVRDSLRRFGVPGFKVLRWERDWDAPGQPFRDPATYPAASVATTGTHDTEPLVMWWETAPLDERQQALAAFPLVRAAVGSDPSMPFDDELRDAFLRTLMSSGSDFVLLPVQDIFGWRDRINVPATVTSENWTYRLPWPIDEWLSLSETEERAAALRDMTVGQIRELAQSSKPES